jgi:hypothetical protein
MNEYEAILYDHSRINQQQLKQFKKLIQNVLGDLQHHLEKLNVMNLLILHDATQF